MPRPPSRPTLCMVPVSGHVTQGCATVLTRSGRCATQEVQHTDAIALTRKVYSHRDRRCASRDRSEQQLVDSTHRPALRSLPGDGEKPRHVGAPPRRCGRDGSQGVDCAVLLHKACDGVDAARSAVGQAARVTRRDVLTRNRPAACEAGQAPEDPASLHSRTSAVLAFVRRRMAARWSQVALLPI